ncbi:hypothetical protein [Thiothrix fructosivorans]|uniref:Uncharacterized protein n=1 Tax=Thiothrix fructosivorans TaxID=111770 RepID=A0A8B0SPS9_9GAMM|nr:hypothetical protein [Thiothrix fructosivorans]MBO0611342.1 hypothetical protein [Thiothrix fructosivorans]QTX12934.1 hypothetical protein J1836_020090 [Thiothrix fructosivorans]
MQNLFSFLAAGGTTNRVAALREAAHRTYRSRESTPPTLWKASDAEAKPRATVAVTIGRASACAAQAGQ